MFMYSHTNMLIHACVYLCFSVSPVFSWWKCSAMKRKAELFLQLLSSHLKYSLINAIKPSAFRPFYSKEIP